MTGTVDFVPFKETITAEYAEGSSESIALHDGSSLLLRKLENDWDPHDRLSAVNAVKHAQARGELLTGLLYIEDNTDDLHTTLQTVDVPLNTLREDKLCPGNETLQELNRGFR